MFNFPAEQSIERYVAPVCCLLLLLRSVRFFILPPKQVLRVWQTFDFHRDDAAAASTSASAASAPDSTFRESKATRPERSLKSALICEPA